MKVLMFGWEFPPFNSGGLGTACQGLTQALSDQDVEVTFVIPNAPGELNVDYVKLLDASKAIKGIKNVKIKKVDTLLMPYMTSQQYDERLHQINSFKGDHNYGNNLYEEALRFAEAAKFIAEHEEFDVIHCHDWMTYKAGINAKEVSGKPLVCHIHATEFDRTGGNNNEYIYSLEREGFHAADRILAVSEFTRGKVINHYGVPDEKVKVVHNGSNFEDSHIPSQELKMKEHYKTVLFVGRITIQKGPDWFIYTAQKVLEKDPHVRFIVAGSGDMEQFIIEKAAELGIGKNILFPGFLRGRDLVKAYKLADVYVMPSISEPFGLIPVEALQCGTPIILSKQCGVCEVLPNSIQIDFWDVDKMAAAILHMIHDPHLKQDKLQKGIEEANGITWDKAARKCIDHYHDVMEGTV